MRIFARLIFSALILLVFYFVLGLNFRLYFSPEYTVYDHELYSQLKYLQARREAGASQKMQDIFPEGLMFFESLYGLAWCDFISELDPDSELYREGINEIDNALAVIGTEESLSIFMGETLLKYGAFYTGWSNRLLGRKLEVLPINKRDKAEIKIFKENCERVSNALRISKIPFLETYPAEAWPADVCVCVSSLAIHDRIFPDKYDLVLKNWISHVKARLDSSGLIPHSVYWRTGEVLEEARGSSQSLILSFLPEIDHSFSREQYAVFKSMFLEKRLGLSAIREYPRGAEGTGDIDSGPVIWDIGTASTIVASRAAFANGDFQLVKELNNGIEEFGFPDIKDGKKYFLGGYLDIGDVFIAWTRSKRSDYDGPPWWRLEFQLWSLLVIALNFLLLYLIWREFVFIRKLKI
ncbi:hypothetical protein FUAX_43410 (plasmid) [Fulvitalea axinellae]|uniref:Uncharacterized protein n=1 Tax=Fulvitalea axinellae TaxID=1182444 RepID=A0AAU9CIE9_9BACT|nr:hypothetical protein FUAX_43410 [Fulvitalea axinellae]